MTPAPASQIHHHLLQLSFLALSLCLFLIALPAQAVQQKYHWSPRPENLAGLDGIVTRCVISTELSYVQTICQNILRSAEQKIRAAGLKYATTGITWERNPVAPYRAAVTGAGMKSPLMLEYFVRGAGNPTGSSVVHTMASVIYGAAVERGSNGPPRSGRLMVWETAVSGNGDISKLVPALSGITTQRLDWLLGAFPK